MNLKAPVMDRITFMEHMRDSSSIPQPRFMVLTDGIFDEHSRNFERLDISRCLCKPYQYNQLLKGIQKAMEMWFSYES